MPWRALLALGREPTRAESVQPAYVSDVILGLGVGFGIGYGVPVLLHYSRSKTDVTVSIAPCAGGCVNVIGSF